MMHNAEEYMVERRADEAFEGARQRVETLVDQVESLFVDVERVVGRSDFGRDALVKARGVIEGARRAVESRDTSATEEQAELLERTVRMFKGVVTRGA